MIYKAIRIVIFYFTKLAKKEKKFISNKKLYNLAKTLIQS